MKLTAFFRVAAIVVSAILTTFLHQGSKAQTSNAEQEIRAIETLKLQYPQEPARWTK